MLMGAARDAIMKGDFPSYLRSFFKAYYEESGFPRWIVEALLSVGVDILEGIQNAYVTDEAGAKWDYAS